MLVVKSQNQIKDKQDYFKLQNKQKMEKQLNDIFEKEKEGIVLSKLNLEEHKPLKEWIDEYR